MITACPVVSARNRRRSSGRRHGSRLPAPITPLRATAAMTRERAARVAASRARRRCVVHACTPVHAGIRAPSGRGVIIAANYSGDPRVYYPRSFLKFILLGFLLVSLPLLYALAELILSLDRLQAQGQAGGAAGGAGRARQPPARSSRRRRWSASCGST